MSEGNIKNGNGITKRISRFIRLHPAYRFVLFTFRIPLAIIGLVLTVFLFPVLSNNYYLWDFARQLKNIDHEVKKYGDFDAVTVSNLRRGTGSGAYCVFEAQRVYENLVLNDNEIRELRQKIIGMRFRPAVGRGADGMPAKSRVFVTYDHVLVAINDGPWDAGLDFRCR